MKSDCMWLNLCSCILYCILLEFFSGGIYFMLSELFSDFEYGSVQTYMNMSVVSILKSVDSSADILTLSKGLDMGLVEINEVSWEGSVNSLKITNKAVTPLLILDGEEFIGAKQNRIANSTYIIPPQTTMNIQVSCVEKNRWNYVSNSFKSSNHYASSSIRRNNSEDIHNSLETCNTRSSNQSRVWADVDNVMEKLNICSDTSNLNDAYQSKRNQISSYMEHFPLQYKQIGSVIVINGEVAGIELLYVPNLYRDNHERIIESYVLDAIINRHDEYSSADVKTLSEKFINDIVKSTVSKFESDGLGEDYRVSGKDITGSFMIYKGDIVNASFFKKHEADLI